ncbi:MAG: ROK family protein [Thomasclavelia ramosa]
MNISNTKNLRQINRDKVMDIFMEQETCTKNQLALATGLSLATITNILKELLASNEVLKDGELESTGGRKSVVYSLNSDYSRMLTISVNKEYRRVHLIYRVYNLADEIVFSDEVIKKEVKVNDIYDIINIVLAKFDNIKVIGISMPGIINDGRVTSTGLTNFNDIDLYSLLTNKYSQVIILGNDVNTAVIGFYLAEKNYENVCLLFQPGEGYGGVGTVINGQLVTGKTNCAGEIQYLPLSQDDQLKLLQSPHGTIELLSKIVICLTAIVNPEIVAISCTNLERASDLDETLKQMVPAKYLPKIKKSN